MPPQPDYDLLVVSDLHLSEGRNPETRKVSLNEDFFFDEEFARFLQYHVRHPGPKGKWHLIINGDFMDFLQVVSPISETYDQDFLKYLGAHTEKEALKKLKETRSKYGFGSTEQQTIYKLFKIMNGHWLFFEALADFMVEGNIVSIGRGNHDVEFIYEGVRKEFKEKLEHIYKTKLRESNGLISPQVQTKLNDFKKLCGSSLYFIDWFHYEPGLIWVEHGNQYDEVNCFRYWMAPFLSAKDNPKLIELPWGSFFVRYLFNLVEMEEPFADNIKPQNRFILWFLTRRTKLALSFLFGDGKRMLDKISHAWKKVPPDDIPEFAKEHEDRRNKLADEFHLDRAAIAALDTPPFRSESVLARPQGWWKLVRAATVWWRFSLTLLALILVAGVAEVIWIAIPLLLPVLPSQLTDFWLTVTDNPISMATADAIRWTCLIILSPLLILYLVLRFRRLPPPKFTGLADRALYISQMMDVPYVTMGHTHEVDLQVETIQRKQKDGEQKPPEYFEAQYFNTGTWTKVFGDAADRLLREESELIFLQVARTIPHSSAKLMKWDDGANEPRLVMLFAKKSDVPEFDDSEEDDQKK